MIDDQVQQLTSLREDLQDRQRQLFGDLQGFRDLSEEQRAARREEMQAKMRDLNADIEKQLANVLLPHQNERLQQLVVQSRLRRGTAAGLGGDQMRQALQLSDDDLEKIRQLAEAREKELEKQIAELRAKARMDVLSAVLTPEQVRKFESMVGEPFQFSAERPFGVGGPGGGPGGGRFGGGRDGGGRDGGDRPRRPQRPGN